MSKNMTKSTLLLGVALGGMMSATPVLAQEQAAAGNNGGDIIVTARRSEERLQDVPISITVFNPTQIAKANIVTSSDLAVVTPSLSINQRFGPEKAAFQIRGFNQDNSTPPTVGTYFADVVAPRVQGGTAGGGTAPVGSFMDLQNVQVLKGPQGTLFGRNTTGGAVLLVPQKPTDRLEGWVEGSAGDYGMLRGQAVLNIPLADTFKVRLSVDRNKRDGYMKNHLANGQPTGSKYDYNDVNYFYGRLGILADLTPDLENYTVAHYSNSFSHNYGSRLVACNPNLQPGGFTGGTPPVLGAGGTFTAQAACDQIARQNAYGQGPLDVEINNPNPYMHIQQWQIINTTTWRASDTLTIKNIASYSEYKERGQFSLNGDDFTSDFGRLNGLLPYPVGAPFNYILLAPQPGDSQAAESTFTEELQFQGRTSDGRLTWQAGGYIESSDPIGFNQGYTAILSACTDVQNLQCSAVFPGANSLSGSATKFYFRNKGIYAQGTYKLTDQLSLTAGIRYTWDRTHAFSESVRLAPQPGGGFVMTCNDVVHFYNGVKGNPLVVNDRSQCLYGPPDAVSHKPTWLIDLDYKPTPDLLLYAKWSRGYRAGGENLTTVGDEGFGPEKVDAYEVGAKYSFHGAVSGYFNIAGFYNDFRDMQIQVTGISSVPGFSGAVPEVNAGKARIDGVEVDSSVTFFDHLKFDLGYTFLDTKLLAINIPPIPAGAPYSLFVPTAVQGGPLAQSPKNRLTLTGTYTLPLDESVGKISIGATFIHTDKQIFTQATLNPADAIYKTYPLSGGGTVTPLPPQVANFMPANPDLRYEPATNIVNINVNWDKVMGSPVDLAFFMTNVTNQIYPVGIGQSWTSAGFESLLYGPPRMWGFRLRYSFGR